MSENNENESSMKKRQFHSIYHLLEASNPPKRHDGINKFL
jgi:hypothetical protein